MADAEFDAPEQPAPRPMRRPAKLIEGAANAPYPKPRDSFEAAVNEGVRQLTEAEVKRAADVSEILEHSPSKVLTDPEALDLVLGHMRAELDAFRPDLSTAKGRAAIASFAHKFAKSKTAIDEAGKVINASLRAQVDKVDEVRRRIRTEFDEMRDEARAPLDKWEDREDKRKAATLASLTYIEGERRIMPFHTAEVLHDRIVGLEAYEFAEIIAADDVERQQVLLAAVLDDLRAAHVHQVEQERLAAEADALRAENERLQEIQRKNAEAEAARQQAEADKAEQGKRDAADAATAQQRAVAAAELAEQDRSAAAIEAVRREGEQNAAAAAAKSAFDTTEAMIGTMDIDALIKAGERINAIGTTEHAVGPVWLSLTDRKESLYEAIYAKKADLQEQARAAESQAQRSRVNTKVRDAIWKAAGGSMVMPKEAANAIVTAMAKKQIPHTRIDYSEQTI